MQFMPLIEFYYRRSTQLTALFNAGKVGDSHLIVDLLVANKPFIAQWWPALAANGLLDDIIATLKAATADTSPTHYPGYPDPNQS